MKRVDAVLRLREFLIGAIAAFAHRRRRVLSALAVAVLAIFAVDRVFPPDMTRYDNASPEVVARDGTLLRAFLTKDGYWRLRTSPSDVDLRYLALLKAYEDKRFDYHGGVDPLALVRAIYQRAAIGHVVSGASTLTMQAARLLEPRRHRTVGTKLIQMLRALQLEAHYSKNQILSIYLTLAPFGGNLEGVRAASLAYFGKEPKALDLSEAATLVALPQSPARQRPDRHPRRAVKGRDHVLARMVADGAVTAGDAHVAEAEAVASTRAAMPLHAPQLAAELIRSHQGRIVTTIDARLQIALEQMAAQERFYFKDGGSLAIVVADNASHGVLGYVAGTDYWGAAGQLDLAARARSPGSALKPFIYGLAFDDLILHPLTMMEDAPLQFGDYAPRDFTGAFQGAVTARDALQESLNVPAVAVLERVGPLRFALALENAGAKLAFPAKDDCPSLPIALGGLGISLADLTMLYTAIPDGGIAQPLRFLTAQPQGPEHRLFGAAAAYYLRQILDGVALPEGWTMAQGVAHRRIIGFKTGTSYGFRDAWSAGFSSDYTIGVWAGRADGAPRADDIGRETAAPILLKAFALLPPDRPASPQLPQGVIVAHATADLPAGLQRFTPQRQAQIVADTHVPPPAISFPVNGTVVPLADAKGRDNTIRLTAQGGREPLTWLVDGRVIGSFDRFRPVLIAPPGAGLSRITVVDALGRSDTSEVRFKALR